MVVYSVTIWVPADGLAHPLAHRFGESPPILVSHPWYDLGRYNASLIVTSMTLPRQDLPPSLHSPFSWFPLGSLPPLSFWGEHLSKTGLVFALISNLKRLLTPESLAFSPLFPC